MNTTLLKNEVSDELILHILPFWMTRMKDEQRGGYYGRITGDNQLEAEAPRGGVLNARILWTFSSAALHLGSETYLAEAKRAKEYIFTHFFDEQFGGTYWMLHADGTPADEKKQIYSQAFFVYALTEYYRVSGDEEALSKAKELFRFIEQYAFDVKENGYFEAYSRDWVLLDDLRLSEKDANEKKTMNTHLHILEAYTNLYRVWKDNHLAQQLRNLIDLFLKKIINRETGHLGLFFDEEWNKKSYAVSYGHDIEASWLLDEAAVVLGDDEKLVQVRVMSLKVADAVTEGLRKNGGLMNEKNEETGYTDDNCDWWVQAESIVGFFNAFQISGKKEYLHTAIRSWIFVKRYILDRQNGEWYWSVSPGGCKDTVNDKAGFWKCPYHNSRMCLELIDRI
ncbi:MAG: AGE family epimerase/isomerase [Proteiniphilum sp.]